MIFLDNIIAFIKSKRVLKHLVFWVALFIFDSFIHLTGSNDTLSEVLVFNAIVFIPQILFSYFLAYVLIPKFFLKKKYILGLIICILASYIFAVMNRIAVVHIAEPLTRTKPFPQESILEICSDWKYLVSRYIPSNLWIAMIFFSVKYFVETEQKKTENIDLAKQKTEIELKTLKGQLNPHFLFNTLNNIYSLSIDNSPKTSESIAKLSEMLDQVLYKSDSKFVPLKSELALIKNYIELEKLRYDERLKISFSSDIEHTTQIPPLILLSLVENAFKHGAGEDDGSPTINISVKNTENVFTFSVKNSISEHYKTDNKKTIGLLNVRKQLDLIYGNSYDLKIHTKPTEFLVTLTINSKKWL